MLDFGLAKLISKRDGDTVSGTPSYMSPEQIRGDDLDVRAACFSLGLLLYEMATGQKAFPGNTGGVIIEAILSKSSPPIRTVNPEIPVELEAIINKAIEKDKEQRYQNAAELRSDLQVLKRGFESGHTQSSAVVGNCGNGNMCRGANARSGRPRRPLGRSLPQWPSADGFTTAEHMR